MIKYTLLIIFCLAQVPQSFADSFSWSKESFKETLKPSRDPASTRRDLKKKKLKAVDPNLFRFRDHRRKKQLTILIFGDSGTGGVDQYQVGKRMYEECQKEGCDFGILLGDIIYPKGFSKSRLPNLSEENLEEATEKFELPYKSFGQFDFWLVPGNHDWYGDIQKSINYTLKSPRWKMPFNHYEIPWLPRWVRMYGLDTTRIERLDHDSGLVKEQMEMANKMYKARTGLVEKESFCKSRGWKILFGHHGIYTSGRHGRLDIARPLRMLNPFRQKGENRHMKETLLPFIKKCGVQILVVGHDHHQEYIKAIDPKTKRVIYYQVLQGAAGKIRITKKVKHPEFKSTVRSSDFGFSIITLTPEKANVKYFGYPEGHPEKFKMYFETDILLKEFKE